MTATSPCTSLIHSVRAAALRFVREDEGATLVEYVLLVALIAAVCVGAVTVLGTNANTKLTTAAAAIK